LNELFTAIHTVRVCLASFSFMLFLTAHFLRNIHIHDLTAHRAKAHRSVWTPVIVVEATTVVLHLPVLLRGLSINFRFLLFNGACIVILLFTSVSSGFA